MSPPAHVPDPSSREPLTLHREARFDVVVLAGQRPRLIVKADWSDEIAEFMREHELADLSLNTGMGWTGGGIEFLESAPPLRSVAVLDWRTRDLSPLRAHRATPEELISECDVQRIPPLAELPALACVSLKWTSVVHAVPVISLARRSRIERSMRGGRARACGRLEAPLPNQCDVRLARCTLAHDLGAVARRIAVSSRFGTPRGCSSTAFR